MEIMILRRLIIVIVLVGTVPLTLAECSDYPGSQICEAQEDFEHKSDIVKEQIQRLDIWYAANGERDITEGQLAYLKSLTEEFTTREDEAIESGKKYKMTLFENKEGFMKEGLLKEIKRVEYNEGISEDNKKIENGNYEKTKKNYDAQIAKQAADVKWAAEDSKKIKKEVDENFQRLINKTSCPGQIWDKAQQKCVDLPKNVPGFDGRFGIIAILGLCIVGRLRFVEKR